jgi:hypothetical protein
VFDALLGTTAVAPFLASKREKIESGNYEAEFPLRWMQKDMHLALVSAYESGVAMPLTNVTKEMYRLVMRGHTTRRISPSSTNISLTIQILQRQMASGWIMASFRTALTNAVSPINAANLRTVHTQIESGRSIGKMVLTDWN